MSEEYSLMMFLNSSIDKVLITLNTELYNINDTASVGDFAYTYWDELLTFIDLCLSVNKTVENLKAIHLILLFIYDYSCNLRHQQQRLNEHHFIGLLRVLRLLITPNFVEIYKDLFFHYFD